MANNTAAGDEYTPRQTDNILNTLLTAETKERFLGLCENLAKEYNRTEYDNIRRYVWGLCTGVQDYKPHRSGRYRQWRGAMPVNWTDIKFIKWATESSSEEAAEKNKAKTGQTKIPIKTLAKILQRDIDKVVTMVHKYGPNEGRGPVGGLLNLPI